MLLRLIAIWAVVILCVSAFLIEPPRIKGVDYSFADSVVKANQSGLHVGDAGTTIPYRNGSIGVIIDSHSWARNWVLRHENCHVRQLMRNDSGNSTFEWELECIVVMLLPF